MNLHKAFECNEMLLDLVCYELHRRRLSPEMKTIFDGHLERCPACRARVHSFQKTVAETCRQQNFG